MLRLVFLGPPGAGKGTQAEKIAEKYGLMHISTGELLRGEIRDGTELGIKVEAIIARGDLVGDDIVLELVDKAITQPEASGGYVLDGFPRTATQARMMEGRIPIDLVVDIDVEDDQLVGRLSSRRTCPECGNITSTRLHGGSDCPKCGAQLITRQDDQPDSIRVRLKNYHTLTQPLIGYYKDKGLLKQVDGALEYGEVTAAIETLIGKAEYDND